VIIAGQESPARFRHYTSGNSRLPFTIGHIGFGAGKVTLLRSGITSRWVLGTAERGLTRGFNFPSLPIAIVCAVDDLKITSSKSHYPFGWSTIRITPFAKNKTDCVNDELAPLVSGHTSPP
jgi:hypothetical protein